MKFQCDGCGRSYIADERVRGRAFKMKCRQCGQLIVVRADGMLDFAVAALPSSPTLTQVPGLPVGTAPRPRFDPFAEDIAPIAEDIAPIAEEIAAEAPVPAGIPAAANEAETAFAELKEEMREAALPAPQPEPVVASTAAGALPAADEAKLGPMGGAKEGGAKEAPRQAKRGSRLVLGVVAVVAVGLGAFALLRGEGAPPVPKAAAAAEPPATGLPPDGRSIEAAVTANAKVFRACVAEAQKNEPQVGVAGRHVVISLTVHPSGKALSPTIDDAQLRDTQLAQCLKSAGGKLQFSPFDGSAARIRVPLVLGR